MPEHVALLLPLLLLLCLLGGCKKTEAVPTKPITPSKVTGSIKEDQLITVELTDAAEKRLGIQTAAVELQIINRYRTYGGEIALPTDATTIISAPVAGLLKLVDGQKQLKSGLMVEQKQQLLTLIPLALTPSDRTALAVARNAIETQRAEATGLVQQAQTQVAAAKIALDRAERLVKEGVGSARAVDEAKAQMSLNEKALEAATSRKKIVDQIRLDQETLDGQTPLPIEVPQSGMIRSLHALPGEFVTAGAPLFEIINPQTVWVRVPVYVGELATIAVNQPAEVGELASRVGQATTQAQPITAPPTATPSASTVDLYYEIANSERQLRPGQRVSVKLPLTGSIEHRVIPWSSVVHDIHGGSWVYEKTGQLTFVRRRIQVQDVVGSLAILDRGLDVGTTIVTSGVAEMFGTEFGFGK